MATFQPSPLLFSLTARRTGALLEGLPAYLLCLLVCVLVVLVLHTFFAVSCGDGLWCQEFLTLGMIPSSQLITSTVAGGEGGGNGIALHNTRSRLATTGS